MRGNQALSAGWQRNTNMSFNNKSLPLLYCTHLFKVYCGIESLLLQPEVKVGKQKVLWTRKAQTLHVTTDSSRMNVAFQKLTMQPGIKETGQYKTHWNEDLGCIDTKSEAATTAGRVAWRLCMGCFHILNITGHYRTVKSCGSPCYLGVRLQRHLIGSRRVMRTAGTKRLGWAPRQAPDKCTVKVSPDALTTVAAVPQGTHRKWMANAAMKTDLVWTRPYCSHRSLWQAQYRG